MTYVKQRALAHYDRMIAWAEKQNPEDYADSDKMEDELDEYWNSDDCVYCTNCKDDTNSRCIDCPLYVDKGFHNHCCDGLWYKMNCSKSWAEWLDCARLVRQYIEEHG